MVYPVYKNSFEIGTKGLESTTEDMKKIADLETFEVSFDNNIEEWTPMDLEGWKRRLATGKSLGITLSGKRNTDDDGNSYVAGLSFKTGTELYSKFKWTMIDGTVVSFDCVVNVTNNGGGDSTNVAGLEFEVLCDGKPTVTTD
jgi:hypothetical protein